jgi:drug/metabolite transporter (DMT)-like permease
MLPISLPRAPGQRRLDLIVLACVVLIWGLNWPVMKAAVAIVPPIWFTVFRYLIGTLVLTGVLVVAGRLRIPHRRDVPIILSVGLLQMLVFTVLSVTALQMLPAGRAAVVAYTTSLWVLPAAALLRRAPLERVQALAGAFGLVGILALVDFSEFIHIGLATLLPYALLLAAAFGWAACMVHVQHHRWTCSALDLAPWQMAVATACVVPFAFIVEGYPQGAWVVQTWDSLLFVGVLGTAFGSWAVVDVGTRVGAGVISVAMTGVPAVGLATSFALGHDTPTLAVVAGSAAILFSIGVVAAEQLRHEQTALPAPRPT